LQEIDGVIEFDRILSSADMEKLKITNPFSHRVEFKGYGNAEDYMERFRNILRKYLTLKYKQHAASLQRPPSETDQERKQGMARAVQIVKSAIQETAASNGLQVKKPEQAATLLTDYLSAAIDQFLERSKAYFENDIKINWRELQDYAPSMTAEQREEQDWAVFIMSLRNHSIRQIMIEKPDLFGVPKLAAVLKDKLY